MKVSDYIASVIGRFNPFVVQGGAAVHLIDSLHRQGHKYVCCAHEQGAGFAADGYGKVKGLGVAITTCGPGATNLLTCAASAWFEKAPVLYITGQQHGFQELDIVGAFAGVTRYAMQVANKAGIARQLDAAIYSARFGPSLLNIFDEVYHSEIDYAKPTVWDTKQWVGPDTKKIFSKERARPDPDSVPGKFMRGLVNTQLRIVTDIGNHGVWVKQWDPWAITDNNFGAMGYALPAAMGVACAGEAVACVTGDGCIQMNIQELATIVKHDLPVKIFVLNNRGYGMIQDTQNQWLEGRHAGCDMIDLPLVDFERIAVAYGMPSRRWESPEDYDFVAIEALPGPVLVNVLL